MPTKNLNDSAVGAVTSHSSATPIVTGVERNEPSYAIWRARGTHDYLLMFTLSGCGRVGYSGGAVVCQPGEVVLIRPGVRHDYGTARGASHWEIVWAHFQPRPHWLGWLGWPEPAAGILHLVPGEVLQDAVATALRRMDRQARSSLPQREAFAINALEEALLWCTTAIPTEGNRADPRIVRAMAFLTENLARPLMLSEVSDAVGLSVSRLSHLFRAQVGVTPMQYLEAERIARARQLLRLTARPITTLAAEVGFESAIHFSLRFKKAVGVSPRDYRKQEVGS